MKKWAEKFYHSKKWKRCRSAYIADRIFVDGGLCEVCHQRTGYIVHHKINLDAVNIINPEIALNHDNLMYVCKVCHDDFEGHFNYSHNNHRELKVHFDENGEPSPLNEEVTG